MTGSAMLGRPESGPGLGLSWPADIWVGREVAPMMRPAILGKRPAFSSRITATAAMPPFSCLADEIRSVLESDRLSDGRWVEAFERAVAERLGVRHAIAVSSCTLGLMLTLFCLDTSGEVILPAFTYCATGHAVSWNRLKLVFADCIPNTMNVDPDSVQSLISGDTGAIVAVHAFGAPCDLERLCEIAETHGLPLVLDAAHAFGSTWQGEPLGKQGTAQVFSFSPGNLLVAGEGGMVTTDDDVLARRLKIARNDGHSGDLDSVMSGLNARLPELSALLAVTGLRQYSSQLSRRQGLADACRVQLSRIPGLDLQLIRPQDTSTYRDLVITVDPVGFGLDRDQLLAALAADGIEARRPLGPPLHLQPAYRTEDPCCLPVAQALATTTLALPLPAKMTADEAERMCMTMFRIQECAGEIRQVLRSSVD